MADDKRRTKWNAKQLESDICDRFADATNALSLLHGLLRLLPVFEFHLQEAHHLYTGQKSFLDKSLVAVLKDAVSGNSDFRERLFKSEAHALAAIHFLRPIYEIQAQLINVLILNSRFNAAQCTFQGVRISAPQGSLRDELEGLNDDFWFRYFNAFVNVIKHRNLVSSNYNVDLAGRTMQQNFDEFSYNGVDFATQSYDKVLQGMANVKNRMVGIGHALEADFVTSTLTLAQKCTTT